MTSNLAIATRLADTVARVESDGTDLYSIRDRRILSGKNNREIRRRTSDRERSIERNQARRDKRAGW
jgi:hypothetical protein